MEKTRVVPSALAPGSQYKIMHVVEAFGAGVGQTIRQIFVHNNDVPCVVVHGERDYDDTLARDAGNVTFVKWSASREPSLRRDWSALQSLVNIIREHQPTLVHCHSSKGGLHGRLAARWLGVPCVYTPHSYSFLRTDIGRKQCLLFKMAEYLLAGMGTTIACGLEEYAVAKKLGGEVDIVENGIDVSIFRPPQERLERDRLTFVSVGRLMPQKDFPFFEEVAREPRLARHQFIWVTGEDAREGAVSTNLRLIGRRNPRELADILQNANCYVNTAKWEGLSRSVLEAAATGLPLLLRDAPGNREIHFRQFVATPFSTVAEAVRGAEQVAESLSRNRSYGLENRQLAKTFYDSRSSQSRMRSLYDAIAFSAEREPL